MRIGIDARRLTHRRLDGRLSYLKNYLTHMLRLDNKNEYILYIDGPLEIQQPFTNDNVVFKRLPCRLKQFDTICNDWFRFKKLTKKFNFSGFHLIVDPYPKLDLPYMISANDLTLYKRHYRCDLPLRAFLKISAWREYNKITFAEVARKARKIHCITNYMKNEFKKYLNIPDSNLKVIYPGGDNEHFRVIDDTSEIDKFKNTIGVSHEYMMAFGNKNLFVLLEAYSKLPKSFKENFSLVVTGPTFQTEKELDMITSKLKIQEYVKFFSYQIAHEKLVWFYNGASLFVLPTQYEMFCNMIIEAMKCKCVVLASKLVPNVEVGDDAIAYYENVNDSDELCAAILYLLDSERARNELAERGHVRGGIFTWENYAREMLELYAEAFL